MIHALKVPKFLAEVRKALAAGVQLPNVEGVNYFV